MDVGWPIEPKHEGLVPWYRLGVYHVGNNVEFHRDIYRFACQSPGLLVLHDLALDDFVRGMQAAGDPLGYVADREARLLAPRLRGADQWDEPLRTPFCAHVIRRSRGVVVHSPSGRRYLESLGCRTPVFVVPHPPVESEQAVAAAVGLGKELRAGIPDARSLIVAPET